MRPVSTMRSRLSCCGTSVSGRWMVTGTTASSGAHSIMTGPRHDTGCLGCELAEKFRVPRFGKAGAVEHVLGDGVGDNSRCRAIEHVGNRGADRRDRRRRAGLIGKRLVRQSPGGRFRRRAVRWRMPRVASPGASVAIMTDAPSRRWRALSNSSRRPGHRTPAAQARRAASSCDRDVGSDAGRLAQRQRQRLWHLSHSARRRRRSVRLPASPTHCVLTLGALAFDSFDGFAPFLAFGSLIGSLGSFHSIIAALRSSCEVAFALRFEFFAEQFVFDFLFSRLVLGFALGAERKDLNASAGHLRAVKWPTGT